jgi:hypothetical protein
MHLVLPLLLFALVAVTVGFVAGKTVRQTYATLFARLFFSDTLHMKTWLITVVSLLSVGQLLLGFETGDTRVYIHSVLGSCFYGVVVAKVLVVRSSGFGGWALPFAGGALFCIILGLWLTSALWFFRIVGIGI